MNRRMKLTVSTIALAIAGVFLASAYAQAPKLDPVVLSSETIEKLLARRAVELPNGGAWKPIKEDMGLFIFRSDRGAYRARLYVRLGAVWEPVATEGLGDIERLLPAK